MRSLKPLGGIALNVMGHPHYYDHLAAVCAAFDVPMLISDTDQLEKLQRYYPTIDFELVDWHTFTPEKMIAEHDVLFISDMWDRDTFHQKYAEIEKQYGKQLRLIHCPHGFSDKGFWFLECCKQDITLVYGRNMLDLIASQDGELLKGRYLKTGNLRHRYYKSHEEHLDNIVHEDVLSQFEKKQRTGIYAPTWDDTEESGTFFTAAEAVLEELPDEVNLIVKLHPNLEHGDIAQLYSITAKHEGRPNVHFLHDFPLIYPLLAACDFYLGDRSAVGYDFLAFNRPMYFLEKEETQLDRKRYLQKCGISVTPEDYRSLYKIIEEELPLDEEKFGSVRKEMYEYTFAEDQPYEELRKQLIDLIG